MQATTAPTQARQRDSRPYRAQNAVLLLFFNRRDTTLQVLEQIAQAKPPRIYLACDGGRSPLECLEVARLREEVLGRISWGASIYTRFLAENHGCKRAVSAAISWFFSYEEQGLILEDDCLPSLSFFRFCDELLARYRHSQEVFLISGWSALDFAPNTTLSLSPKAALQEDYFFSRYPHIWGWASWARAWRRYRREFPKGDFPHLGGFLSEKERRYWRRIFRLYARGGIDTWDYPLAFSMWRAGMLAIYPKHNMVCNIGFNRSDATHTKGESKFASMPCYELAAPLIHPSSISHHRALDSICFRISFSAPPLLERILRKLARLCAGLGRGRGTREGEG